MKRIVSLILVLSLVMVMGAGCTVNKSVKLSNDVDEETGLFIDKNAKAIAEVEGQKIYDYELALFLAQGSTEDEAYNELKKIKVFISHAVKDEFTLTEDDRALLQQDFDASVQSMGGTDTFTERLSAELNVTPSQYRAFISIMTLISNYSSYLYDNEKIEGVNEAASKQYFLDNCLRAKHVLYSTVDQSGAPLSDEEIATAEAKAKAASEKGKAGEDFDAIMADTDDPGSATQPDGYVFFNTANMDEAAIAVLQNNQTGIMVAEFEKGTADLAVGEVSEPILTSYGYHVIKRYDISEKPEFYEQVKQLIRSIIIAQKLDPMLAQWAEQVELKML